MTLMQAKIGTNVKIAKTAIIEENVEIGDNTEISDFVIIRSGVKIGSNCKFFPHSVIGEGPQDKSFLSENSYIEIGDNNVFREFSTVHKAVGMNQVTKIGDNNYVMVMAHIGHNVQIGNNVVLANKVALGGHVVVEDFANIGGGAVVHQNCRIGKYCMVSGLSATNHDLVPFFTYGGIPSGAVSTNRFALKKAGYDQVIRTEIMRAFKIIYSSQSGIPRILERLETELLRSDEIDYIINFIKNSKRSISLTRMALGRTRDDNEVA